MLVSPPMMELKDLYNGEYQLYQLEMMHQILDIKQHAITPEPPPPLAGIGGIQG